jgi:hypothetical protein
MEKLLEIKVQKSFQDLQRNRSRIDRNILL